MDERLRAVFEKIYTPIARMSVEAYITKEPVPYAERASGERRTLEPGDKWGDLWDCAWMRMTCDVPEYGGYAVFRIDVGGEACVFDESGTPYKGLTNKDSFYSFELGMPGKQICIPQEPPNPGEKLEIWLDCGANDLFGEAERQNPPEEKIGCLHRAELCVCDKELRALYYDLEVIRHLADATEDEALKAEANEAFESAISVYGRDIRKAREITAKFLSQKSESGFHVTALGHAHIDLAWLWPLRETRRKAARTFSTLLRNCELYPEYLFGVSQPQMLEWVKTDHPALYAQMKELYNAKRLEPQGGFWVECDTNVPGGESLVRQMLYGKRYFKEEFGYDEEILWIPDVFGYNAQLPQIMKKSGVKYFLTIKLSWNSVNRFPHSTFRWIGLDGSEVLTHMPPEGNYNSAARAESLLNIEKKFMERDIDDRAMMLYGIGDGGGGPGMEHLERLRREYDLKGLPKVKQAFAIDFFRDIDKDRAKFPEYRGELYLEKHQGTYTTQSRNKRFNRECENAFQCAEIMLTAAHLLTGLPYPKDGLEKLWKEVLLYQFHDIIPGSSIKRVYDESCERYENHILPGIRRYARSSCENLRRGEAGLSAFNPAPFARNDFVRYGGGYYRVEAPALGFGRAYEYSGEPAIIDKNAVENEFLRIEFTPEGGLGSVTDKEDGFEYLRGEGNVITSYSDTVNAWEVPADYAVNPRDRAVLRHTETRITNGVAEIKQEYAVGESRIFQTVTLCPGSRRIDFVTSVDWNETHRMLRAAFPLAARNDEARCDIQYGDVRRPTHTRDSFAKAKKEICAHKWVDISDENHGVSLLNNCKYGHRVWDCTLDIDLLRSSMYPGIDADKGRQEFTYSLYPHKNNYVNQTVKEGYLLNRAPLIFEGRAPEALDGRSMFETDAENVAIDWVKLAEDDGGVIVRAYEFTGRETSARIVPAAGLQLGKPLLCDLTENVISPAGEKTRFGGYEIITLKFPILS